MNVPFGDLKSHYALFREVIDEAVQRVLSSGHYILGAELERFEKEFASYLGSSYVVGCGSGTDAIYLALAALQVGPGDEVITVAHTAVPTISAISMTGATPVFVDVHPDTMLMDVSLVESKITARTKAIVPVHLYGQMVDMESLTKISQRRNIAVVEDVAQATGATFKERKAGTIGVYGTFSFYPSKNLGAFGDGGAVCCDSKEGYEKLIKLRNYGQSKRYHHDIVGINSRLDELQAAILRAQLPYLEQWNTQRCQIAERYSKGLTGQVELPVTASHNRHVYHLYVIQVDQREKFQEFLLNQGVQTLIHYPKPAHLQPAYTFLDYEIGDLPVTERIVNRIVSLPMYPGLTDEQVDFIIASIRQYVSSQRNEPAFVPEPAYLPPLVIPR